MDTMLFVTVSSIAILLVIVIYTLRKNENKIVDLYIPAGKAAFYFLIFVYSLIFLYGFASLEMGLLLLLIAPVSGLEFISNIGKVYRWYASVTNN